jgi:hypothetical protein
MTRKRTLLEWFWNLIFANFGTKAVSIVIAAVLWGIVLGSRSVEVTKEVPLEIITSPNIVASNDIPDRIAFRLSGPKAFMRTILDRKEEPVRVNLSSSKPTVVTYRFFSDSIRVPIGVKVLAVNPTSILIKLENLKRRDVPLKLNIQGTPPEGFRIVKAEVKPETVRIKGPESRVDGITELTTSPIDVSQIRANLEKEVPLDLSKQNVQLEGSLPRLLIQLEPVTNPMRAKGARNEASPR